MKPRDVDRLNLLIKACHPCVVIRTMEERPALDLIRELLLPSCWRWSTIDGVCDWTIEGSTPTPDTEHAAAGLYHLTYHIDHPTVAVCLDLVPHLGDAKVLRLLRELIEHCRQHGSTLILIDHSADLPAVIDAATTHFELSLPDDTAIEAVVRKTLKEAMREQRIEVEIKQSEFSTLLRNLRGLNTRRIRQIIRDLVSEDRRLDGSDLHAVLTHKRQALHSDGLLEYVETPVHIDDIGGMQQLKHWLAQRCRAFSQQAEAFGLPWPRGVLLLGVQGAGKSLAAKAVAAAWQRPLLRLDPSVLYDRFVGESERRLRDALEQAEAMAPIVLWVDEIEKGFASAASNSTDGGLSQRMFGSMLTWMQEHEAAVFVVATANNIDALPPELLRKGRFDDIFFVDLPDDATRAEIFRIHLEKRKQAAAQFDIRRLAQTADGYSGAEIEQAVIAALHEAFSSTKALNTDHIVRAIEASPPLSCTMAERVQAQRQWAQHRCRPAH